MKKPLDRISEAYFNKMGSGFGEKVRKRVHWICENAFGESILDVGCSQGITSILLAREGKKVLGIDLLKESIEHAEDLLSDEAQTTIENVDFKIANFMNYDFGEKKYDTIIFGEILEHIADPHRFINRASTLLREDGRIIVTVPFGINDYFDHKKTYYLEGLLRLQNDKLELDDVVFLGNWVGTILTVKNNQEKGNKFNLELLKEFETKIYDRERDFLNQIAILKSEVDKENKLEKELYELTQELREKNELIKEKVATIEELEEKNKILKKELYGTKNANYEERKNVLKQVDNLKAEIASLQEKLRKYSLLYEKQKKVMDENKSLNELEIALKKENELLKNEIEKQLDLREREIKELENVQNKHQLLEKKYFALYNSLLGKFTIKYWKLRKKLKDTFPKRKGARKV
ncbi:methyltransferase domain-containing protein [Sediminibacillus terrae]|uniref:methyltransferase domain-containing protein n=1 Tax=Sediminibacillus terrae TaxID=1562106 RepID=UPI001295DC86|nr:methyltransferase domain-containing protein [Sediminibacillus terrae]